ncbi:MAG: hypothetical protein LC130_19900 [Bryobacterales bacterium]|nr:hypothetical protein [Bryobacterales bacterium]
MLTPKVGTSVWYYPGSREVIPKTVGQPLAAIVSAVHSDGYVNLMVAGFDGSSHARSGVSVDPSGTRKDVGEFYGYCVLPDDAPESEGDSSDPIDAKFEDDDQLRDFFLRTVEALISQDRHDRTPLECAQKAWMVTDYVRSCLADLK